MLFILSMEIISHVRQAFLMFSFVLQTENTNIKNPVSLVK